jgi:hypothetical protein
MTDAPSDADAPCHDMPERECKLVKRIEKSAQTYDQLSRLINEIVCVLQNNDWYFINHMVQIRSESSKGLEQRESYIKTLEEDSVRYERELRYMKNLVKQALGIVPVREIRLEEDDSDGDVAV